MPEVNSSPIPLNLEHLLSKLEPSDVIIRNNYGWRVVGLKGYKEGEKLPDVLFQYLMEYK